MSVRLQRLIAWYEGLNPVTLDDIGRYYAEQVYFKDAFQVVQDRDTLRGIFARMFEKLEHPRFEIVDRMEDDGQAFMTWDFHFGLSGRAMNIRGSSHLRFGRDDRVTYHRDYIDSGEEIYEKVPVLGGLIRMIKRRIG